MTDQKKIPQGASVEITENIESSLSNTSQISLSSINPNDDQGLKRTLKTRHLAVYILTIEKLLLLKIHVLCR